MGERCHLQPAIQRLSLLPLIHTQRSNDFDIYFSSEMICTEAPGTRSRLFAGCLESHARGAITKPKTRSSAARMAFTEGLSDNKYQNIIDMRGYTVSRE